MNKQREQFPFMLADSQVGIGISSEKKDLSFYIQKFPTKKQQCSLWKKFPHQKKIFPKTIYPLDQIQGISKRSVKNPLLKKETSPNPTGFKKIFNKFKQSKLKKVVLAKKRKLSFAKPLHVFDVLNAIKHRYGSKGLYAYFIDEETGIVGISPENLFIRKEKELAVDCTGGTVKKEESNTLLEEKYKHEHGLIRDYVKGALDPLCTEVKETDLSFIPSGDLLHLHQKVYGTLKDVVDDDYLIKTLHPTPAVCGTDKEGAFDFIDKEESFYRGLYAGLVGWQSPTKTSLWVNLRIAIIDKNVLTLYAGAGITKNSILSVEEIELERKFNILEEVFIGR